MVKTTAETAVDNAELSEDVLALRKRITARMDLKTRLDSLSDMAKLVTGPLFAVGCTTLIGSFINAALPIAGALTIAGVSLVTAGALALGTAIIASFKATQIMRDTSFDQNELAHKRAAHHLVETMRANNLCLTGNEPRRDGKNWTETVQLSEQDQQRVH